MSKDYIVGYPQHLQRAVHGSVEARKLAKEEALACDHSLLTCKICSAPVLSFLPSL